jgi:hypothetical protein
MLMDILTAQQLETEERLKQKDHITSLYLDRYPDANRDNIYTALIYLEDPMLLLEMSPDEVACLLRSC